MSFSAPTSLRNLRKFAELNLCKECYPKYLALIEGNVERMLLDSFHDWRGTESLVTQMVMKSEGVFKTRLWVVLSLDENPPEEFVDSKKFKEISHWDFTQKLDYLRNNKILPDNCYKALKIANKVRNKLHTDPAVARFSERDLQLFACVHQITSHVQFAEMGNAVERKEQFRLGAEEFAKQVIQEFG